MRFVNCAKVFSAVIKKANVYESTKLHILNCHLNLFSTNLADKSDEHGERFHQHLKPQLCCVYILSKINKNVI